MALKKILVIEDDRDIQELIVFNLTKDGFNPVSALSGEDGLIKCRSAGPFDLIILDLMLPGIDGLEVCRTIRSDPALKSIPILMATAKGSEADIVTGLELGADDYLVKPFSPRILIARIKSILRRRAREAGTPDSVISMGTVTIHPGRHLVTVDSKPVYLTAMEFRVLQYLAMRPGWVFTRGQILSNARTDNYPATDRSVDVVITGIRKKLGPAGDRIETVRGIGYRLKDDCNVV